jgi:TetR/AcrR family transcriptional regulator, lmrAB and yxaGH operons repressor
MPRASDARERLITTTARLLQEQGYANTGLTQILTESGAPKGSFYFHFPDGKDQLAVEALRRAGAQVAAGLHHCGQGALSPADLVDRFIRAEAETLRASGFRQGCPIATVALELSSESDLIQAVCKEIFDSWIDILAGYFAPHVGGGARSLAEHAIMCMEGGLLISRVQRDTGPLLRVLDRLQADLVEAGRRYADSIRPGRRGAAGAVLT